MRTPVGAWGDPLTPSVKAIAVSDDLIALGLTHKSKVHIAGLKGEYIVLDRMNPKWKQKIDVYMGNDFQKAKYWGNRKVIIKWSEFRSKKSKKQKAS